MKRLAQLTTIYALVATLVAAAPLSASEEPAPPAQEPAPAEPAEAPTVEAPTVEAPVAEPAAGVGPESPAPVPEPPPSSPEPAAQPPPEPAPQELRDDAPAGKPTATAAAATTVTIKDFEFAPASITVDLGDTVTWSNAGPTPHSATANDGSFDTGVFAKGQSRTHTFDEAGTFSYFCTPHPFMKGTVTVRGAASGGGDEPTSEGDPGDVAADTGSTGDTGAAAESDSGPSLPATGLDAGGLGLLGLMTFALGACLRRRADAEQPSPARHRGW